MEFNDLHQGGEERAQVDGESDLQLHRPLSKATFEDGKVQLQGRRIFVWAIKANDAGKTCEVHPPVVDVVVHSIGHEAEDLHAKHSKRGKTKTNMTHEKMHDIICHFIQSNSSLCH